MRNVLPVEWFTIRNSLGESLIKLATITFAASRLSAAHTQIRQPTASHPKMSTGANMFNRSGLGNQARTLRPLSIFKPHVNC